MSKSQIQKTEDHSIFSDHLSNREVDAAHVRKLSQAIRSKNLLHINPIVVDEDMRVIDGQHRLEAARQMGIPIYYVVDGQVSKRDIALLNSNQKNWTPLDYVNYWTLEKAPGFDILSTFLSKYPFFPVSAALLLIGNNDRRGYKEGKLNTDKIIEAEAVAQIVAYFAARYDFCKQRNFAQAILQIHKGGNYDHQRMIEKVDQQPRSLVPCINTKQYVEMLEEIYNYRMQTKVKFS